MGQRSLHKVLVCAAAVLVAVLTSVDRLAHAEDAGEQETAITQTATACLGTPYVWGGDSLKGFDCSGFVQYVYERNGIPFPRVSFAQFRVGHPVALSNVRPGDLVFFNTTGKPASHVGISVGGKLFIHASSTRGITIASLANPYWARRISGARRNLQTVALHEALSSGTFHAR